MRKLSRKGLIKKLDKLVSNYIIKRDGKCVICGATSNLNNGHIFSRRNLATRWDITEDGNCHCQCYPCNFKHTHSTYPYNNWYIKKFGIKKFDTLYERWNTTHQLKDWQIKELIETFPIDK